MFKVNLFYENNKAYKVDRFVSLAVRPFAIISMQRLSKENKVYFRLNFIHNKNCN